MTQKLAKILEAPLIKAYVLQIPARIMRQHGFEHPLGDEWRGIQDINPEVLPASGFLRCWRRSTSRQFSRLYRTARPQQIARTLKGYMEAGLRVCKILDYGGMAGLKYAARSAQKVREAEDEIARLVG